MVQCHVRLLFVFVFFGVFVKEAESYELKKLHKYKKTHVQKQTPEVVNEIKMKKEKKWCFCPAIASCKCLTTAHFPLVPVKCGDFIQKE